MNRKPLVMAAAGLALLGLSACNPVPGDAAYVGDHRIAVSEVQDDTAEVIAAAAGVTQDPLDPTEVNRRQVNRLVTEQLVAEQAARRGIDVTDAEVDGLLAQAIGRSDRAGFEAQLAASQLVPPSRLDSFARTVALNQKLMDGLVPGGDESAKTAALVEQLGALSAELGTGVAARFGTWDPSQLTVGLPPNDLSTPAPQAQVTGGTVQSP